MRHALQRYLLREFGDGRPGHRSYDWRMSIPPRLASRFNEVMGSGAAEDLVSWMDDTSARHAELRADLAEIRQEIRAVELRLSAELGKQLHAHTGAMAELAKEFRAELHAVDNKIEKRFSDLLLWSFVFWVGAVSAIALLAGVLKP
jgi:hypothetical protein